MLNAGTRDKDKRSYSEVMKENKKGNIIVVKPKTQQNSEDTEKIIKEKVDIKKMMFSSVSCEFLPNSKHILLDLTSRCFPDVCFFQFSRLSRYMSRFLAPSAGRVPNGQIAVHVVNATCIDWLSLTFIHQNFSQFCMRFKLL